MFFCPKCKFSLDISKNIPQEFSWDIQINLPKDFIDRVIDNELDGNIKIKFSNKDLISSKEYKKLTNENKIIIDKKFVDINNSEYNIAYFVCNNCQFTTKLNQGTSIYKVSLKSSYMEDNSVRSDDNTLPRTKDYICPNTSCDSQKNDSKKEAVFYRPNKNSYKLYYNCLMCNTTWDISNKVIK